MDGYQVVRLDDVVREIDIFVTATQQGIITAATHGCHEASGDRGQHRSLRQRDRHRRLEKTGGIERIELKPQFDEWRFTTAIRMHLLSEGRLLNLATRQAIRAS